MNIYCILFFCVFLIAYGCLIKCIFILDGILSSRNGIFPIESKFYIQKIGIIVRFLGEANTSWDETKTVRDDQGKETNETEHLTGHEEYFEIHYYLLGSKNGSEINLPAGEHTYPFTCALPPTLPSSFEGEWGHVRYTIKVTLDRPWKFDQDAKMAFTVVSPVDLNVNPRLKVGILHRMRQKKKKHFKTQ